MLAELLLGGVREESRDLGAARRDRAERKADGGGAQPGRRRALPVCFGHPERSRQFLSAALLLTEIGSSIQRLADREQAHREHHHVDAVEELRHAEREARLAGLAVDAGEPEEKPEEQRKQ